MVTKHATSKTYHFVTLGSHLDQPQASIPSNIRLFTLPNWDPNADENPSVTGALASAYLASNK